MTHHDHRSAIVLAVAFCFHAPGLWLFWRMKLGVRTKGRNLVAVSMTLVAMAAAYAVTGAAKDVVLTWAGGHVLWGAWLSARVFRGLAGT